MFLYKLFEVQYMQPGPILIIFLFLGLGIYLVCYLIKCLGTKIEKIPHYELLILFFKLSIMFILAYLITFSSVFLGPWFFNVINIHSIYNSQISPIDETNWFLTSFVAVIVGYFFFELTRENRKNKLITSTGHANMQCNYLLAKKIDAKCNYDFYKCLINPQIEYDPEIQAVYEYCRSNNFVNCPRVKLIQIKG